jgi:hypothetical protein
MKTSFESSGNTGRIFESEILSTLPDTWRKEGFFDEAKSYEWVRQNQTWNPSDPTNKIANELHYKVAEQLGLDDVNELKFYSALGSPLDYFYGVDAFFEIGNSTFTLDLSINPHKKEAKADMVVHEEVLDDEKELDNLAVTIGRYLKKRQSEVNLREAA